MENSGEAEDDQGSGWFEVKKKNRTSSKLASQKVSGGSSFKTNAYSLRNQSSNNDEAWKFHCVQQPQTLRAGFVAAAHPKVTADSPGLPLVREDEGARSIDKVVANQENQPPKKIVSGTMTAKGLGEKEKIEEAPMKKNVDVNLKIKWGDLEEESMAIIGTCLDSSASLKTKCTDEDDGSQISPCTPLPKETLMKQSESVQQFPGGMQPLLLPKESADESCEEANETLTEAMVLVDSSAEVITEKNADEGGMTIPSEATESVPSAIAEEAEDVTIHRSRTTSEFESLNIPAVSIIAEKVSIQVGLEDIKLLDHQKSSAADPIGIDDAAAMAKGNFIQNASADGADLGECESEESKERFRQRLWCFLFENLNRAVDELYLLCELECDKEQMDEAILVLEEAASDFRELKSRVENFESTKRSPSQSPKNSPSVTLKLEHRRPHALSWEVRRMTNSAHRAEILSSSLETFKKIQQERFGTLAADNARDPKVAHPACLSVLRGRPMISPRINDVASAKPGKKLEKQAEMISSDQEKTSAKKQNGDSARMNKAANSSPNERIPPESLSASAAVRSKREPLEPISETQKQVSKKDKIDRQSKGPDMVRKLSSLTDKEKEKEKEKRNAAPWKSLDAWKEKRNWEDILKSPMRPSRVSHSPGMGRKGQERARILHDKLMSPEKRKRSAMDMKREAEEKHARAMRIRSQLEHERMQRLQRTSEKLNRVNEWQAVRSLKLREGMHARHQRGESRHEAYLAQVVKRAGDESSKVNEVRFITSLNEENKKLMLRQKLHDSEVRRAEKLQVMRSKQKEDMAREEAVLERRKLLEAEKLQRLAETQRKKEEAQVRREEERKASSAAREARVMEQLRRKEVRAKAQQEEAELLALRLAERLRESEQRRKFYLEQIREKASMDFRDQSSPLVRRSLNKEGQNRSTNMVEDYQTSSLSTSGLINTTQQQSLKRKIKKIRQRLMALKHEFAEPSLSPENQGVGYRALVAGARAKVGRWLQELQRLRQARKEGAASIGLIVGDMIKFLDGKEPELHASRQAGLLDFISSALPASHTSKPEACQVTAYLLRLLRVVLSLPANRSYFLAQNLLPPIIPMLSASLENYIKMAASSCPCPGSTNLVPAKTLVENLESITDILDGFLWTVTTVIGHVRVDERQLQMQSGLVELIVAYQVIHCLRDLFALYDRPQVEGAPFPSSILLSLNLLTVLTSSPASISSIDWDSCIARTDFTYEIQEARLAKKSTELGNSHILNNTPLDDIVVDSPASGFGQEAREEKLGPGMVSGTDVPEGRPEDGQFMKKCFDNSVGSDNAGAASQGCTGTMCDLPRPIMAEEQAISQKDENVIDCGKERKGIHEDTVCESNEGKKEVSLKQPVVFLLYAVAETSLVSLPSLLTAVLLQANSRMSSEQASYVLPLNFEEVATGVLKVLNNLAVLDITLLQSLLARSDLKVEFFHLMSFLLSHCTSKWKTANDQIGLLLLESLLLLGYFALFHPENQAVLRWGKSPTILHKVCDLPFVFFSDPELTPILAGTLVAACYGCDQNRGVVRQELSMDMLLSVLKSCRQGVLSLQTDSSLPDNSVANDACDGANQSTLESKKPQVDLSARRRSLRVLPGKGGASGSSMRSSKTRTQRESRGSKTCDEWALKHSLPASEAPSTFMLHRKFPCAFLDKAEEFFSVGNSPI